MAHRWVCPTLFMICQAFVPETGGGYLLRLSQLWGWIALHSSPVISGYVHRWEVLRCFPCSASFIRLEFALPWCWRKDMPFSMSSVWVSGLIRGSSSHITTCGMFLPILDCIFWCHFLIVDWMRCRKGILHSIWQHLYYLMCIADGCGAAHSTPQVTLWSTW